jgi:type I restriction enzyme S subunit
MVRCAHHDTAKAESMSFITRTLGDICNEVNGIIRTGPFGSQLHERDYQDEGLPVVMPKDIVDGKISTYGIARIGEADEKRLAQHKLHYGDIVYGRRGDIGRRALITEKENGWLCGTGCLRISLGSSVLHPTFLFYYLGHNPVINWIYNQAIGATLPNLNTTIIRSVPVTFPPLPIQRRIAAVLSAYDDLIENNVRRMAILEEMARNLYREWFVHFRFPGHEHTPLIDSGTELGMIPEGWEVKRLTECVLVNPTTRVPKEGMKPFVPMSSLANNSMLINDIELRIGNSGSKFRNGDTLFARITPCLENGKTGYVQFLSSDDVGFGSTEFIVLRSKTLCPELVYLIARSDEFRNNAIKSMSGASGRQRVQELCFEKFLFAHPDERVLAEFSGLVAPIFHDVRVLDRKNTNLRRTRDLLLPKLVSGEVDVSDIEIQMGEATE